MKKTILIFVFILTSFSFCLAQEWFTSLDAAKRFALTNNKMLFVLWEDSFDYPYHILIDNGKGELKAIDLFSNYQINKIIWDNFIPVKLDESKFVELSNKVEAKKGTKYFNKLVDDSIKIMDANGKILNIKDFDVFLENLSSLIKHYALNTSFLKQELMSYFKEENFTTSFRLASKYLDFAIFVEKDIRFEILQLANIYFDEAKYYLIKSDLKNINAFSQKFDLLKIKEYLILNKHRKARRHLSKINISEVDKINQSLFYFLNYTVSKLLKNEEDTVLWKSKISSVNLKKAKLIIRNNS